VWGFYASDRKRERRGLGRWEEDDEEVDYEKEENGKRS